MKSKSHNTTHLSEIQYLDSDKLNSRWDLYNFCVPQLDIYHSGIQSLDLKGGENVLEVGCGDGGALVRLKRDGHIGKLVGTDIGKEIFRDNTRDFSDISFIHTSADDLPFEVDSFDVILAFFMLYHMPDIQKTLMEWKRVLRTDGRIVVATSSTMNRPKHKKYKKRVEEILGKKSPAQFSSSFNMENGKEQLEAIFEIVEERVFESEIQLYKSEPYLATLDSIRDMFQPVPSAIEWKQVRECIKEEVEKEIEEAGYFTDYVKRGYFICKNNK